jgi:hypothetical protein
LINRTFLVASAVIGGAIASGICTAATSECKLVRIAEWPVRLEHSKLIVDGAINGRKIGVMLDTGAQLSLIMRSAAIRLGLTLRMSDAAQLGVTPQTPGVVARTASGLGAKTIDA